MALIQYRPGFEQDVVDLVKFRQEKGKWVSGAESPTTASGPTSPRVAVTTAAAQEGVSLAIASAATRAATSAATSAAATSAASPAWCPSASAKTPTAKGAFTFDEGAHFVFECVMGVYGKIERGEGG